MINHQESKTREMGERLRSARLRAGYASAVAFAREHGFNPITYRSHESGQRRFKMEAARAYAEALSCPYHWLLLGEDSPGIAGEPSFPLPGRADIIEIPYYDLSASAGHGAFVEQESVEAHFPFSHSYMRSLNFSSSDNLAMLSINGDSMEPNLHHGDLILVDRAVERPQSDGIYVIRYDDFLMAKRIAVDPFRHKISVTSDNPAYPPIKNVDADEVSVLGKVIWLGRKL